MKKIPLLFIIIFFLASACHKIFEKPTWKTDVVAPLVKTSIGVQNILKDTSFKAVGDTVKFVSRQKLYNLNLDSLAQLHVTPYTKNVKLSSLELSTQVITQSLTLGRLAREMIAAGNPIGYIILGSHGSFLNIDPQNNLSAGPIDIDVNQFFEYAELKTGDLTITIENRLPVNISRLEFELKNKTVGGPPTAHEVFTALNAGTSQSRSSDMAGKTVEGTQVAGVLDMDIQGGFVQIDTNSALVLTMSISNVSVTSATAIFPAQDVIDEKQEASLEGLDDVRLRLTRIHQGFVDIDAYSTADDTIYFSYKIPNARKNGVPFSVNTVIRPAPPNGTRHETYTYDFNGYELDLTGKPADGNSPAHDTSNTFYNELLGRIEYTGKKVHLSLDDSLYVVVSLRDVIPSYIGGYLGQDTIDLGNGSVSFDVFKNIESGILNFEKVKISLVTDNGLGIDGKVDIKSLQSVNTKTGQSRLYSGTSLAVVDRAASVTAPTTSIFTLDGNAVDLLNILPDKINYNVSLQVNNNTFNPFAPVYPDFASKDASLTPYLDIELPLSILADQLRLSDTIDFVSENFKTSVNSGTFSVNVLNGFPMSAELKLLFLNSSGNIIDSAQTAGSILPGIMNNDKRVIAKSTSKVSFYVDEAMMQNVLRSRQIIFQVKFSSPNATVPGSFVKIFSDYTMDFTLAGDFNYTIE